MKISGPDRYELTFDASSFAVRCSRGTAKFSGLATSRNAKLYVVSRQKEVIYVGVTKQPIRSRLRLGWQAKGEAGYHGYAWRHDGGEAALDVWCMDDASVEDPVRFMETIEAEVVFLVRAAGQWPRGQTEIHFHSSSAEHRRIAKSMAARYGL